MSSVLENMLSPIKDFEHNNDILFQKDLEILYKKEALNFLFL